MATLMRAFFVSLVFSEVESFARFALEQVTIYNGASEAIGRIDELLHTTTSVYDEIGRMLKTVNHLGESSSVSEYDIAGRMSAQIDPFGQRTEYAYDDAGRTVSVTDPEGNTVSTLYDDQGRVESTTTPSGTTRFGYDFQSRQIQTIDSMLDVTQVVYCLGSAGTGILN